MVGGEKNKMFAVGQEPGPAMSGVLRSVEHGSGGRSAALRAHFQQRALKIRSEHNRIAGTPASAARIGCVGYGSDWAASGGGPHNFAAGKEPDIAAVGRPE